PRASRAHGGPHRPALAKAGPDQPGHTACRRARRKIQEEKNKKAVVRYVVWRQRPGYYGRDRARQGCRARAYRDVFTACPARNTPDAGIAPETATPFFKDLLKSRETITCDTVSLDRHIRQCAGHANTARCGARIQSVL